MPSGFRQFRVLLRSNLLTLRQRLALSLSMVFSITLVVLVLAGFLSMAAGFERTLKGSGSASVAVIFGGGARQEMGSDLSPDSLRQILALIPALSEDIGLARDPGGNVITSREVVVTAEAPQGGTTLALRGMDPAGPGLRDGITLSSGRIFAPGTREIVVGEELVRQSPEFAVGSKILLAHSIGCSLAILPQMAVPLNPRSGPISTAFRPPGTGRGRCKASGCG